MTDKLLPCPFCGGEASPMDYGESSFTIQCIDCGSNAGDFQSGIEENLAIEQWNTRFENKEIDK